MWRSWPSKQLVTLPCAGDIVWTISHVRRFSGCATLRADREGGERAVYRVVRRTAGLAPVNIPRALQHLQRLLPGGLRGALRVGNHLIQVA